VNERRIRLEAVFHAATDLDSAEEREHYLTQACAGDPELRREVDELLKSAAVADSVFQAGREACHVPEVIPTVVLTENPGDKIGRYKLLEHIGEGGMGVVYMAEQEQPVRRKVALKIIKLGMDTRQVVARFGAERQALALMDHPHIAKVLDAGATDSGRPYFVMELVQGVPITEFCVANQLSIEARLKLFITVSQAIQSAHQKGVIHRDIKPTNVLVTMHNGQPHPMVIDFGVAKATNQKLTEKTLFTNFATMIGTPAYMSPEQAEMSKLDVDTRSDIYSLGVLLYELLTGSTPFPEERLRSVGYGEMQRIIAEEDPERPSTRLRKKAVPKTALRTPHSAFDSDLDWIVMKCLEKDRNRRYETANGLAADLNRHLNNEPVLARPPSMGYRLQKMAQRNKVAFTAVAAITGVLMLAAFISIRQAVRATAAERKATSQARTARAVKDFLVEQVLAVNPYVEPEPDPNRLALARRIARNLDGKFPDEPHIEAELRWAIGGALMSLGERVDGEAEIRRTYEIRSRILGTNHSDTLWSACWIAQVCAFDGRTNEALTLLLPLLPRTQRPLRELTSGEGEVIWSYGDVLFAMENTEEAIRYYEQAIEVARRTMDSRDYRIKNKLVITARAKETAGRMDQAEALFREGLHESQQQFPPDHPLVLKFEKALAGFWYRRGRLKEAGPIMARIIPANQRVLGTNHSVTLDCELVLGEIYHAEGRVQDALAAYANLHSRWAAVARLPNQGRISNLAARLFVQAHRFDDARTMLVPIRASFAGKPPTDPQDLHSYLVFESAWAAVLDAEGKGEEATAVRVAAITDSVKNSWPPPDAVSQIVALVRTLRDQKRYQEIRQALAPLVQTNRTIVPRSSEQWDLMVEATAAVNGWPAVADFCRQNFELFPDSPLIWLNKAWIFRYVGDEDSYRRVVEQAIALSADVTGTNDQHIPIEIAALGPFPFSAEQVKRLDLMIDDLKNALPARRAELQTWGYRAVAQMQLRLGRLDKCLEALEKSALTQTSPDPYNLFIKAICLHRLNRGEDARAALAEAEAILKAQFGESFSEIEGFLPVWQIYQLVLMHRETRALLGIP